MFCVRCFRSNTEKVEGEEKRWELSAAASVRSTVVSTGERSNLTFSTASSAVGTSVSEDSSAVVRHPAASKSSGSSARSIPELYEERGANSLRRIGFRELRAATSDFSRLLKLGEGGFGSVYKGVVRLPGGPAGGTVVATKKLNRNGHHSPGRYPSVHGFLAHSVISVTLSWLFMNSFLQLPFALSPSGHKQWLAEVQFLGAVEHQNLVKLIGYCADQSERGPQRLLVYEFMTNKTLSFHGTSASNVLLDEEFRAKLSDFGLAREVPSADHTHVSTAVMGTLGYAAPDYIETGHLTTKCDVWSFGVVLYEILTGRCSLDRNRPNNEQKLLEWVRQYPAESKQCSKIIDTRLEGHYSKQGTG
ncbi:hypothetical protein U9M48_022589 [Paspalum notatum var. saurae]|uniref:Protein kinase domain-containing protein n=1 Tax=Paspalum notatum var. saurae TaxID=547442 RepID=A0AAQ3WVB2_PASNO